MRRAAIVGVLVLVVPLVIEGPADAATIVVTTFADQLDGAPPCSLREAVRSANADVPVGGCSGGMGADRIELVAGIYTLSLGPALEDDALGGDLDVAGTLTITGAARDATVIDGVGIDRAVHVAPTLPASLTLQDLTIAGGGSVDAAGILVDVSGTILLEDAALLNNDAGGAGAGGLSNKGSATLRRVVVMGNRAGDAIGGIGNQGIMTIRDSTIARNEVTGDGAGAGIANQGHLSLENVTISGNGAGGNGGGIANGAVATLNNVTVTGNVADSNATGDGQGGGIANQGTITLMNTILAGNGQGATTGTPDCEGTLTSRGHNLLGDPEGCTLDPAPGSEGDVQGSAGSPLHPRLAPLADNGGTTETHALLAGSPAIDSGDPGTPGSGGTSCAANDQRGAPRNCDIGAYELVTCRGTPANRIGSDGPDVLRGTRGPDGILGFGGRDALRGVGGRDRICGGNGRDTLRGGGGRDLLAGEAGRDVCIGGGGRDRGRSCERTKTLP